MSQTYAAGDTPAPEPLQPAPARFQTGVPNLDLVLGGGLLRTERLRLGRILAGRVDDAGDDAGRDHRGRRDEQANPCSRAHFGNESSCRYRLHGI